ncbi:hypothetical protein [Methanolobus psychrotolerans]|uniref:hypothetical protein n=1 Tax=Methanolobus psychrotolerans TaxID=1874706 RepID=UPI000B91CAC8|nr:hypothetical protein [Methanolobus psychrotolerans]
MATNKIIKFNLETRAVDLQEKKKPYAEIAELLSSESGEDITQSSVQRFFASREKEKQIAVAKSDKLKARVAEAEINTIDEAMACIGELKDICSQAKEEGDFRTAIQAIDKIYTGLDIVNKVLGKYKVSLPESNCGVNIMFYLPGNNRDEPKIVGAGHGDEN